MLDAPPENRTANCCRSGILSAWAIDQPASFSSFDMVVGGLGSKAAPQMPQNLTLQAPGPGYTCGPLEEDTPTVVPVVGGRREEQVFNEATIFWGLEYLNKELLQAGDNEPGSVMTEMVIQKDPESFTLRNGWAFPRKVYFNIMENIVKWLCQMAFQNYQTPVPVPQMLANLSSFYSP